MSSKRQFKQYIQLASDAFIENCVLALSFHPTTPIEEIEKLVVEAQVLADQTVKKCKAGYYKTQTAHRYYHGLAQEFQDKLNQLNELLAKTHQ